MDEVDAKVPPSKAVSEAAGRARRHVEDAREAFEATSLDSDEIEGHLTATDLLLSMLADGGSSLRGAHQAVDSLRCALQVVQDELEGTPALEPVAESVARALAVLHPALRPAPPPDEEPLPLTRRASPEVERERRQAERVDLEVAVGLQSESTFFSGLTEDLSAYGLFVATYELAPIGTRLCVSLILPNDHQIVADARVAWIREGHDLEQLVPGMGLRFDDLQDDERRAIEAFLEHRPPLLYDFGPEPG